MILKRQDGAVALLTTIIISILLTIITTGLLTLMVAELRQANDAEQSVRAYYAAQSGVEDAIAKVVTALGNPNKTDQTCATAGSQNLDLDNTGGTAVGWSCQQILYSGSPSGSLPVPDKAVQIDIGNSNVGSVKVEWDLSKAPPANFYNAPATFPASPSWAYAAPLETTIVEYNKGAFSANTPGAITLRNAVFKPHIGGTSSTPLANIGATAKNPINGVCVQSTTAYHCSAIIANLSAAKNYLFRLRSRYVGTDYKLTFYAGATGNGAVVNVPDGTATIDITAKAGDSFRRVIYKVPYSRGAAQGLDYVIYSEDDICKNFSQINGGVLTAGCPYP
jgi:hypothetical protein